jgi:hypothetical protein
MSDKIKLSSPWAIFYREVQAMFAEDPDVKVVFDEESVTLKLYVEDPDKADALKQILPVSKSFGNVAVKISIIPANQLTNNKLELFERAFKGNGAFVSVTKNEKTGFEFVIFKSKVVQFFNDDLTDVNGLCSTLYQNIAKDIFLSFPGINFCTEAEPGLNTPLGEWP